jgi:hypothetical protein
MKKIHFIYKVRTNEKKGPFSFINVGNQWRKWFYFIMGPMIMINFIPPMLELMKMTYFSSTCCCVASFLVSFTYANPCFHLITGSFLSSFHPSNSPFIRSFVRSFIHHPPLPSSSIKLVNEKKLCGEIAGDWWGVKELQGKSRECATWQALISTPGLLL